MNAARERLLQLLKAHSFERRRVLLSSGRESDYFVDCKQTVLMAEGHALVGRAMLTEIENLPRRPLAVAGVELGGCPLASAVALLSSANEKPIDALYVRKGEKAHGSRRQVEGHSHLPSGATVVVVEDVVTTGGSTIAAMHKLREHGMVVEAVVAIVDRAEGGADAIRQQGVSFRALFRLAEFL